MNPLRAAGVNMYCCIYIFVYIFLVVAHLHLYCSNNGLRFLLLRQFSYSVCTLSDGKQNSDTTQ